MYDHVQCPLPVHHIGYGRAVHSGVEVDVEDLAHTEESDISNREQYSVHQQDCLDERLPDGMEGNGDCYCPGHTYHHHYKHGVTLEEGKEQSEGGAEGVVAEEHGVSVVQEGHDDGES